MNLNPGMGVADLFTVDSLVYVAFLASVSGLLTRDELRLRVLILIGSGFYLAYYRMAPDTPLWGAIITNSALACANLYMIFVVISERTTFAMDHDTLQIYRLFDKLSPGQFRRLFRLAGNVTAERETELTEAGNPVHRLFYVVDGAVVIRKGETATELAAPIFIGEIAFLTGQAASASVSVKAGSRYLVWEHDALTGLARKAPALENALMAHLNSDMAAKVANSRPVGP